MLRREFIGGLTLLPFLSFTKKDKVVITRDIRENLYNKVIHAQIIENGYSGITCITPFKTTYSELISSIEKYHPTRPFKNIKQYYHVFFDEENSLGTWFFVSQPSFLYTLTTKNYVVCPKSLDYGMF